MINAVDTFLQRHSIGTLQLIALAAAASFLGSTSLYVATSWICGTDILSPAAQAPIAIGIVDLLLSLAVVPLIETAIFYALATVAREAPQSIAIVIPALGLALLHAGHGYPRIYAAFFGFLVQSVTFCILQNRKISLSQAFWTIFSIHALHNATAYGIALAAD